MTKPFPEPEFPWTDEQTKWLADLASGVYDQAGWMLRHKDGGYCCLGLLCEGVKDHPEVMAEFEPIFTTEWDKVAPEDRPHKKVAAGMTFMGEKVHLPGVVQKMLHLRSKTGRPYNIERLTSMGGDNHRVWLEAWTEARSMPDDVIQIGELTDLNDTGVPFEEIAMHLRRFPHFYFDNGGDPTLDVYPFLLNDPRARTWE